MDAPATTDSFLFGRFRLDPLRGLLRRDDVGDLIPVGVGSRALAVLRVLVERHGELVSKDEIMVAAWPNTVVEEANLTMQISALRRILDDGSEKGSCIQTVSGRGYRFVLPVSHLDVVPMDKPSVSVSDAAVAWSPIRLWLWFAASSGAVTLIVVAIALMWLGEWPPGSAATPRLSLVVLPFQNLSGDPKDDYLADGITDDLTSDLSDIRGARVAARATAYTFKGSHWM
jgi:DNA-binding winged helix-turn-helix (wHTH) protein